MSVTQYTRAVVILIVDTLKLLGNALVRHEEQGDMNENCGRMEGVTKPRLSGIEHPR